MVFSCIFAALTVKYKIAEKVLVPLLDILQSIPVLGFLSITVTMFIAMLFTSVLWRLFFAKQEISIDTSIVVLIFSGILVGFGSRYGSGCTSGHGICGIARLSKRSIIATFTFMAFGMQMNQW